MNCPRCGADVAPGDRFCADCGSRIAPPDPPGTGGRAEAIGAGLAGRTDPGLVHRTNQDAFMLSGPADGGCGSVLVLSDGVSNSQTPELAAATAVRVVHDLLDAARGCEAASRGVVIAEAIRTAHEAVCALPFDRRADLDPPAATIIAAWLHDGGATISWLGDSRAYALAGGGGRLLTRDHSWITMTVDQGRMTEAEARRDPRAHALISCLGTTDFATASPCPDPAVLEVSLSEPWLMLCSDGLWNYAETAGAIAGAAGEGLNGDAADLCARLVEFARAAGGHDNITVLAARAG